MYAGTLPGFPRYLRVVYVQQHDIVHVDDEVLEYVTSSDAEKKYLEAEEERLLKQLEEDEEADAETIQERLESVTDRLSVMDARRASTRASAILTGLGFTLDMQKAKINSLSGGWKQRVALACALFIHCDLLLLVQPHSTHHTAATQHTSVARLTADRLFCCWLVIDRTSLPTTSTSQPFVGWRRI